MTWEMHAACIEHPADLFDPIHKGESTVERERRVIVAARVCRNCPVRDLCLITGRRRRESGVWGGLMLDFGEHVLPNPRDTKLAFREAASVYRRTVPQSRESA